VAGPWFTVHRSGSDWQEMGKVWISNGKEDCRGRLEIKIELERRPQHEATVGAGQAGHPAS